MAKKLMDRLFKPEGHSMADDYVELDAGQYETAMDQDHSGLMVKVAALSSLNGLSEIKKEIYDGHVVLIDISAIKRDKMLIDRATKDLRRVVADVQGDIVELSTKDQIIVTPANVKVDRAKVEG